MKLRQVFQSFNGAVDLNPRKHGAPPTAVPGQVMLQWGRGFESTETAAGRHMAGGAELASMGPWI